MSFPSIRIEGSILSPDILERFETSPEELPGQRATDFGLEGSVKVKDEIARAWADAQDYWRIFQRKLAALRPESPATSETRQQWMGNLLGLLDYKLEYQPGGLELNGRPYAISHLVTNRGGLPLHIVGFRDSAGLDRKPAHGSRMSAHAVVQEYINLHEQLFGIVTNGRLLRLLRDSSRLIKLSYLEFDLDRIFTDGLYADFAVLYRLLHASRLPTSTEDAPKCLLEQYHQDSLISGSRIREGLSRAVKQALEDFGNGFLTWPTNDALRRQIADPSNGKGHLDPKTYYGHLLRLIYRLLFLMVVEERGLLFPPAVNAKHREIYNSFYSLARLRRLAEKPYLAERNRYDLWQGLVATFALFESAGPGDKLGIKPLAGDLFSPRALGPLSDAQLSNEVLLRCLRVLSLYEHRASRQVIRVNYAALNVEELGSVYEGLLELRPSVSTEGSRRVFSLVAGDERSATGSHYTPDELVQPLIKHSLDYLIAEKLKEPDQAKALLSLRVADIACGSGHILLSAARRIALELAFVRTGEEQPSPSAFRAALREVIQTCIYGVDLNPLAVELCKVALWLEAHSPGEPLNFLDHHIKCGNAIVGFVRPEEVDAGVPDEAFATQPHDDKTVAARLRKANKKERELRRQLGAVMSKATEPRLVAVQRVWHDISTMPEETPQQIEKKKLAYQAFADGPDSWFLNQLASIPIAQFYLPKTPENEAKSITDEEFRQYWEGKRAMQSRGTAEVLAIAQQKRFFHWFLEFPEIIAQGGFDCILGNPPYLWGQALSGKFGHSFCNYVKWAFAPAGLSDLVVFFVRRIFSLLHPGGMTGFISTNSIKDGDNRRDSLDQIISQGGEIVFVVRAIKWPGQASLVVSLVSISKTACCIQKMIDGCKVDSINSYFEDAKLCIEATALKSNINWIFQGVIFLGDGFMLSHEEADELFAKFPQYTDIILPVINGRELNGEPDQLPRRRIICFWDWPLELAQKYPVALDIVLAKVRPEREKQKDEGAKANWWNHLRPRMEMYSLIGKMVRCFVTSRVTKYLSFSSMPTNYIYPNTTYVFTTDRWDLFSVVQSTLHEVWARKHSMSLKQDLQYSPSDCFINFPFPKGQWQEELPALATIGERYHEHRRKLMLHLWLGLTDIYNLFHLKALSLEAVMKVSKKPHSVAQEGLDRLLELRRLHRALDEAVRDAYGWTDLKLEHDFYEIETLPENDRVRYTISPAARKQVLAKLLALNLERAQEEAAAKSVEPTSSRTGKGKGKTREPAGDTAPQPIGALGLTGSMRKRGAGLS